MLTEVQTLFRPSAEKRRILLVEDEPINQEILRAYLEDSYEILVAPSGAEALELLHAQYETLSLILLDLNLPDIHGLELLRRIKEDSRSSRLSVIVMTADSEAEVESLTLGASDFIPKPYPQQKVVLARIMRTIELSEDRDTLSQTERDHLTGLYNREFFYRYAIQLDAYHKDFPTDAVVLDVNRFHTINERYGKRYGDELLRRLAGWMLSRLEREGGIACRSKADTFLVYCPHREDYDALLEELSEHLDADMSSKGHVRLRMGVYADVDKSLDAERRFDRAKLAADTVKNSASNAVGRYDRSLHEAELLSEQLIDSFPDAIRRREFQVYYQPKFNVRPDSPVLHSAEALVRWRHPTLGMVSPGVFIPLFEKSGLIQTLDQYVWAEAAAQIRRWKESFGVTLPVSVNVSRVDLFDPLLKEKLRGIVEDNGLGFGELLLEITESAYAEDSRQLVEAVRQLRALGFRIEMDDFGSGYSSLSMLSVLPIDILKLDIRFIRSAFAEYRDTRLLDAVIRLAGAYALPVVAEGVETAEQVAALRAVGCRFIQGYYFSRPLPAGEFERFIEERKAQTTSAEGD